MLPKTRPTDPATRPAAPWSRWAAAVPCLRCRCEGQQVSRRLRHLPNGGTAVFRQADCATGELRRAGGDCDGERAAARRIAPAHARSRRIARIPDRNQRCAEGHQPVDSSIWNPVLQTVVTTAVRLCRADPATIYRNEGGEYRWAAGHMLPPDYEEIERNVQIRLGPGTLVGRVALRGRPFRFEDAWTDPLYEAKDDARIGGVHTMLGVPLLREGVPIGVIGLARDGSSGLPSKRDRAGYDLRRPGGDRDRERAAVRRIARAHRRARALGRRAEDAGRSRAGGQLDARSEGRAVDDPHRLARDDLGECRGDLSLHPGRARLSAGRGGGVGRGVVGLGRRSEHCRDRDR